MNSYLVPFQVEHLDNFQMRESEVARFQADPKGGSKIEALTVYGMGATIFYKGLIIGIIGYYEMWPGVIEIWAFPSIHVTAHSMVYLRHCKRYVELVERTYSPHRLQTCSYADDIHTRWMEFLGFHEEGTLKKYTVFQEDFKLWAKTYD